MKVMVLLAALLHTTLATRSKYENSLNFLIHGDWGWASLNQSIIAYEMGIYAWMIDAQFVMALGDNFYEDGIDNTTDPLWNTAFHDIYSASSLEIPWYPILGNHDYHASLQAQVDRSNEQGETMWTMPGTYYALNFTLPGGGVLSIINIDTAVIDPDHDDTQVIFNDKKWEKKRKEHLQWIDDTLAEHCKYATWVIVAGHYPIYSIGVNGDNTPLLTYLYPILKKYNIHIYVAGHDHNHQFFRMSDGIYHIISGQSAGRGPFGAEAVNHIGISAATPYLMHYFSRCGFVFVEADTNTMNVSFVDDAGKITYTGVISNPHTSEYRDAHYWSSERNSQKNKRSVVEEVMESNAALYFLVPVVVGLFAGVMYTTYRLVKLHNENAAAIAKAESGLSGSVMDSSISSDVGLTAAMDYSGRRTVKPFIEMVDA